ncbi:alpha/beta fold hydrolase [Streptomyces sp. NPDC020807]|uniref:thioesterase II family protein n=1 Tax=Streptomyces sp. NPDC020807 TaxID=3155119 RepID=UPI0033D1F8BC
MKATATCSQQWIRRYHPKPERRITLVALPHAGGSASYFHPLSKGLGPDVEMLAVQYPGRQERRHEAPVEDIGELADRIMESLMPWDGPIALFGHSMGATVAFEVARRCEAAGAPPAALIVSARRAPSAVRDERYHELDDDAMLREMKVLGGSDAALSLDEELVRLTLPVLRSDFRAVSAYRCADPTPLTCPVTALVGAADPRVSADEVRLWSRHTTGPFQLKVFSGGHFYLADHQQAVTDLIRTTLTPHMK